MGQDSKIQWTEATWNPWHGCVKVSEGCKFCYMFRDKEKYGQDPTVVSRSKTKFSEPLNWMDHKLVFTCSWSDWFIDTADEWRKEAWEIIKKTPHLTYQILTKRSERILQCLPEDWGDGYPNVWLGVSVENKKAMKRINDLIQVPAAVRFLSCEPLLEDLPELIPLDSATTKPLIDWVIVGGESGNNTGKWRFRPCELGWIQDIINQCRESDVPVFVKQLGTNLYEKMGLKERHGGDMSEWPARLQVRQMPKLYRNTILFDAAVEEFVKTRIPKPNGRYWEKTLGDEREKYFRIGVDFAKNFK